MRPPFIFLPIDILDGDLTLIETRVLLALYSFRSRNSNTVWPSRDEIAARAGYKTGPTISRTVTSLARKGWLTTVRHQRGSEYTLTIPEMSEPDTEDDLFAQDEVSKSDTSTPINNTSNRFVRPDPELVTSYARSIGFDLDGSQFCDYYESKGWLVGRAKMKDWKAAVRTWKRNHQPSQSDDLGLARKGI